MADSSPGGWNYISVIPMTKDVSIRRKPVLLGRKKKITKKRSRENLEKIYLMLCQIFLFKDSPFVDHRHFSLDSQVCLAQDSPSVASTAENPTTREKNAQSSRPAIKMDREYRKSGKVCVRGRLKENIQFWRSIDACKFIIGCFWLQDNIHSLPQGRFSRNNKSLLYRRTNLYDRESKICQTMVWFPRNSKYLLLLIVNSNGKRNLF